MKKKKRRFFDIIRIIGLLIAFSVLLYPTISNYLYEKNSSKVISLYDEEMAKLDEEKRNALLEEAKAFNKKLSGDTDFLDPFLRENKKMDETYSSILNISDSGMMGYIKIPKLEIKLPIYHGTQEKVLQSGIGHLEGTSFPVGGENTHCVLTGHRGLPSKILFTNLDKLQMGDIFYINVLGENLAYEVNQILTVFPEETESLRIVEGKDYVTLVTCTPYGINTHRLLVRGTRISYEDAVKRDINKENKYNLRNPFEIKVLLVGLGSLIVIGIIFFISSKKRRKRKKNRRKR